MGAGVVMVAAAGAAVVGTPGEAVVEGAAGTDTGAGAMGVNRNRWTWPLGMAACMSCWPGPGMIVTPLRNDLQLACGLTLPLDHNRQALVASLKSERVRLFQY